jgi:hypothetical protein
VHCLYYAGFSGAGLAPASPRPLDAAARQQRRHGGPHADQHADRLPDLQRRQHQRIAPPIVLCASLTPPDDPTSGLAQTEFYTSSLEQVWTLLPVANTGFYLLQHKLSGLAAQFGAQDAQIALAPFVPFDQSFYIQLNGTGQNVQFVSAASPNLMFTVGGSSYTPPTPVTGSVFNQAQGQSWLVVAIDTNRSGLAGKRARRFI